MKERITEKRKDEQIRIILEKEVEEGNNGLNDVILIHNALPELDFEEIDTRVEFLGKELKMPLMISGMTGGTEEGYKINKALAEIAEKKGIGMGLGSQRVALENPKTISTFYVRDVAPNILLLGNISAPRLKEYDFEKIEKLIEEIEGDGIAIHLNPAHDFFQKDIEIDFNWKGCVDRIREFCEFTKYPVIVKEVGCGISREVALKLKDTGIKAIDIAGWGGTNWVLAESYRSGKDVGEFRFWGIPTSCAIIEAKKVGIDIIASGGIRTGLDIAKSIALGAKVCAIAAPFLRILKRDGKGGVEKYIDKLLFDLKATMLFTGCKNIEELRKVPFILSGLTKDWIEQRT
jgi:isopentenyl-diphosphate delta-isomerase